MKFVKTLLIIVILLTVSGCITEEKEEASAQGVVTFNTKDVGRAEGNCILTASAENDGKFLMVSRLFESKIPCKTKGDCYNFLLEQDDYRRLAPEFEPYLNCEDREDMVSPNKIYKIGSKVKAS